MKKIYKYGIVNQDIQYTAMPEGAEIISCQMQGTALCLWAIVDPNAPLEARIIEVACTGNTMTELNEGDARKFIATVVTDFHIWHVFEIVKEKVMPQHAKVGSTGQAVF